MTLLVMLVRREPLSGHRPMVRTPAAMCAPMEQTLKTTSPSWTWPHALGEREAVRGGISTCAVLPRGAAARKLGLCGVRTHEHQLVDIGRVWPTRWLLPMRAGVAMTRRARAPTALWPRGPSAHPREAFASSSWCAHTITRTLGGWRSNAGFGAVDMARCTRCRLDGPSALFGAAISRRVQALSGLGPRWCDHAAIAFDASATAADISGFVSGGGVTSGSMGVARSFARWPIYASLGNLQLPLPTSPPAVPPPPLSPPLLTCLVAIIVSVMLTRLRNFCHRAVATAAPPLSFMPSHTRLLVGASKP